MKTNTEFYKMNRFPEYEPMETFSKTVLIYDEAGEYSDLGFYNFDSSEWTIFGDFSFKLACWCYIPSAKEFIEKENIILVEHSGYRD